jgi:succinate dehydrogenase / fumarate reductase cytochrome b subunit
LGEERALYRFLSLSGLAARRFAVPPTGVHAQRACGAGHSGVEVPDRRGQAGVSSLSPSDLGASNMSNRARPLSPHLQIYRPQITTTMSIMHRITGVILSFGAFVLAWWLLAVAQGGDAYERAAACLASPFGKLALFGFSLALVYHLLNGIRHLLWDAGWGFQIPQVYKSGYTVLALTVVFTAAIWFFALRGAA